MLPLARPFFLAVVSSSMLLAAARGDDWPQWRGTNRDGVWRETGIIQKFGSSQLTPKWRIDIGSGYCGPTIAHGRVYVMDLVTRPASKERIHCLDESTGENLWSYEYECAYGRVQYPAGPRACVTLHQGKAYALGATGQLHVFDAASGTILWKKDLDAEYSINLPNWGISAAPLIHENLVILHIGGSNACILALNKDTGEESWRALNDPAQYSAPILVRQAGQPIVL